MAWWSCRPARRRPSSTPLPIGRLWGVGERTRAALAEYGVAHDRRPGAAAGRRARASLRQPGPGARRRAPAASTDSPGGWRRGRPSRSATSTPSSATPTTRRSSSGRLLALSEGVAGRLRAGGVKAATVAVKVRDSSFVTHTRQRTLAEPTDQTRASSGARRSELARPAGSGHPRSGCWASRRRTSPTASSCVLFDAGDARRRKATEATDLIRQRFGSRAITRARLLESPVAEPFERDHLHAPEAKRVGRSPRPTRARLIGRGRPQVVPCELARARRTVRAIGRRGLTVEHLFGSVRRRSNGCSHRPCALARRASEPTGKESAMTMVEPDPDRGRGRLRPVQRASALGPGRPG